MSFHTFCSPTYTVARKGGGGGVRKGGGRARQFILRDDDDASPCTSSWCARDQFRKL